MSTLLLGQLAALAASLGFALGPTFFTLAGQRIGSRHTLRMRLLLSTLFLLLAHRWYQGAWQPLLSPWAWWVLWLSGVLGLALADVFLFEAFVRIGPRLSMLVLTLVPVLSTLVAWFRYQERLTPAQLVAMALVLGGVGWVVTWGQDDRAGPFRVDAWGLGLALVGTVLTTLSALMAKEVFVQEPVHPVAANLLRMSGGMTALWLGALATPRTLQDLARALARRPYVLGLLVMGSLAGPVIGMSLQMFAFQTIPLGLATTLTSLPPILLLPISRLVFRERFTGHAVAGTVAAVAGVAWLLRLSSGG